MKIEKVEVISEGVKLITVERAKQIFVHNRTIEKDVELNYKYQLANAASSLLFQYDFTGEEFSAALDIRELSVPNGWNIAIWQKMVQSSYEERLVIAGALIAAELDRLHLIKTRL